ncbi:MAG: UvrD-helicase domain-containing protein [Spirochaetales bacterium]|nr:UvrD-helicase domain-containing protein [Spirochaetales bacterium]
MAEKRLNPSQQRAVDINVNGVITAGAGSGKTTVLALRFLRLVKEKRARVDEILTLTFTRKAAAEMYSRIHKHFTDNQDDEVVREELGRFDLAQISTLDSFCSQIVRGDCARYGIPEDFRLDKPESDRMIQETAMAFLLEFKNDPSMERLLEEYGFKRVLEAVWYPLGGNVVSLAAPKDFTAMAEAQFEATENKISKFLELLLNNNVIISDFNPAAGKAIGAFQEKMAGLDWEKAFSEQAFNLLGEAFADLGSIRMPGRVAKPDLVAFKDLFFELRPVLIQAAGYCSVLGNREHIYRTAELAKEFQDRLIRKKRSSGLLTFHDVMELAVEILKNNLKLRHHFKNRFKYIMIDEFQDNNQLQKDLLFLLAEEEESETPGMPGVEELSSEKLYFVGDEKQSIYRFRGADVSVFKGLSNELESCGGEKISLDTNYRSEPGLIDFFNEIFPSIMGSGVEEYEAGFQPLGSREANLGMAPHIKLFYSGDNSGESSIPSGELEAFYISRYIKERVEARDLEVFREGRAQPAGYDDFAVLFRSGSNQFVYEKYFRNMGIPYDVSDVRSLFMEAPANDIYALLQLAIYPEDRSAYGALLRSPFINLGDDSMIRLILDEEGLPFSPDSDRLLLREDDRIKFASGRELYQGVLARADRNSLLELIRWIWYDRGYRFTLLKNPSYHHYLEYYDYLSALARSADERGVTLAGFLDEIRPNLGQNKKLDELTILKREVSGVRIMTVHASKGLEFPVTILADCGSVGRSGGEKGAPFFFHPEMGISLRLQDENGKGLGNPVYAELEKEEKARELAEMKRLLYVALTRSECHLILAGRHTAKNQSGLNTLLNLFLSGFGWQPKTDPMIIPGLDGIIEEMKPVSREDSFRLMRGVKAIDGLSALNLYEDTRVEVRQIPLREYGVTGWIHSLEGGFQEDAPKRRTKSDSAFGQQAFDWMDEEVEEAPDSREELPALVSDDLIQDKELETRFGTLCHIIMEEMWGGVVIPGRKESLLDDLSETEAGQLIKDGETICGYFFAAPFAHELKSNFTLETEISFLMKKDDVLLRGQIDLLARARVGNETRVIDFKTDKVKKPEEHHAQLELYAEAVRGIEGYERFSEGSAGSVDSNPLIRAFLCYLRDGSVQEIEV